jgi:hypothetical protein
MFVKRFFVEQCEELKQVTDVLTYIQANHPTLRESMASEVPDAYELERLLAIETYCNHHKDVYGCRPYGINLSAMSLLQIQAEIECV